MRDRKLAPMGALCKLPREIKKGDRLVSLFRNLLQSMGD